MNKEDNNNLSKKRGRSVSEAEENEGENVNQSVDESFCRSDSKDSQRKEIKFETYKSPSSLNRSNNSNLCILNLSPVTNIKNIKNIKNINHNNISFNSNSGNLSSDDIRFTNSLIDIVSRLSNSPVLKKESTPPIDSEENCLKSLAFICEGKNPCVAFAIWKKGLYASANSFSKKLQPKNSIKSNIINVIEYFKARKFDDLGILPQMLLDNLIFNSFYHKKKFFENTTEKTNLLDYLSEYFYENDPQQFSKYLGISKYITDPKIIKRIKKFIFHYKFVMDSTYCIGITDLQLDVIPGSETTVHAELKLLNYLVNIFPTEFPNKIEKLILIPSKKLCFECHYMITGVLVGKYQYNITTPKSHFRKYGSKSTFPAFITDEMIEKYNLILEENKEKDENSNTNTINHSTISFNFKVVASEKTINLCEKFVISVSEKLEELKKEQKASLNIKIVNSDQK